MECKHRYKQIEIDDDFKSVNLNGLAKQGNKSVKGLMRSSKEKGV